MVTATHANDFTFKESPFHFHIYKRSVIEPHNHDYWEFFIILQGQTTHCTLSPKDGNEQSIIAKKGMGALVHPSDVHYFSKSSSDFLQLNLAITDEQIKKVFDFFTPDLYDRLAAINEPVFCNIEQNIIDDINNNIVLAQVLSENDIEKYNSYMKFIWIDVIKTVYRVNSSEVKQYPLWLNEFIQKIVIPPNIVSPVTELHKLTYFSYRHLARLFQRYVGITLSEYMQNAKMQYAAMLLRTTDNGILAISSELGYDSLSHFIHAFKQVYNMTPKEYRHSSSK